jgi:Protein kinase domain
MGVVYRAVDTIKGREVALKVLLVGQDSGQAHERFKREARSLARLSHKAIVGVHHYGVHEGVPFLTMDFVPGTTLQSLLESGALKDTRAADLLAQIAWAVDHAHSRGVVHRDIKPANVLIGSDGAPRITDFGLAKLSDASVSLTHDGDIVGTPVYMSPEQIQGDIAALGPSADIWALGVTLYFMLTGKLPFVGSTVDEVGRKIVQQEPAPPRTLNPDVPEDLEAVCLAALRKDPTLRYRSAGELARDLVAFMTGNPVLAGRVTAEVRARRVMRAVRLHSTAVAFLVGSLLALAALGGWVSHRSDASSRVRGQGLMQDVLGARQLGARKLQEARESWTAGDVVNTQVRADEAVSELERAAGYLDRVARIAQDPDGEVLAGMSRNVTEEEVARGLIRDPVLETLRFEARALRGRALVELKLVPKERAGVIVALTDWFRLVGDTTDLEALTTLSERSGWLLPAHEAWELLEVWPAAEEDLDDRARRVRLRVRLLDLGALGAASPAGGCPYCGSGADDSSDPCSACGLAPDLRWRTDVLGRAAAEAAAALHLRRGDVFAAWEEVDGELPPDGPAVERLARAAVARAGQRWGHHRQILAPLFVGDEPAPPRAYLERGLYRLSQGHPRSALLDLVRAREGDPSLEVESVLPEALALALCGQLDAAKRLLDQQLEGRIPPALRLGSLALAAAIDPRWAAEAPPGELPDEVTLPLVQAQAELTAARSRPAVADVLGVLASAGLSSRDQPRIDVHPPSPDAVETLTDPGALACAAALFLWDGDPGSARAVQERLAGRDSSGRQVLATLLDPPPVADQHGQLPLALRALVGDAEVPRGGPSPRGLRAGRAALARYAHDVEHVGARDPVAVEQTYEIARTGLTLAVNTDPFHPAPRIARAQLYLLRAAYETDPVRTRLAREAALADAAVACLGAPGDPQARGLILQAAWVVNPRSPHVALLLTDKDLKLRLEGYVDQALRHLDDVFSNQDVSWVGRSEPEDALALRLVARLLDATENGHPPSLDLDQLIPLPSVLRQQLAISSGVERAYLEADLLLQDPSYLTLETIAEASSLGPDHVRELGLQITREGPRATQARVARLLHLLRSIRDQPQEGPGILADALEDLEWVDRSRPQLGARALRVGLLVWSCTLHPEELDDLLVWDWEGELHDVLRRLRAGQEVPDATGLVPLARLRK